MDRSQRKMDHIQHALSTNDLQRNGFDDVRFIPNSLPNIHYGNTLLVTDLGPFRLTSPIFINAMTGGAAATTEINQKLAIIAKERGLAMAVGSQMAALRDPTARESYTIVRKENPHGILFANIGAEATVEQAQAAVEMIEANALQIHLNVMQELLMPEGDRDFSGYLEKIQRIKNKLSVPVLVKEVGFGMSADTIQKLVDIGIQMIDVGGRGGTNFAKVENLRRSQPLPMFDDWGLSTVESLLEASILANRHLSVMATGGVRHGLDVAKALSLGAEAVGIAGALLRLVKTGTIDECLQAVDAWHHEIRIAMTSLGIANTDRFRGLPLVIMGQTADYARLRGIDLVGLAQR
ncbi:type 2 isopentenyl-diphosphate Delta-isomerase [Brevibacillus invocatus]|uniref:type 2 isopentenyl-diphosphate Delta-isomerase n=1 Tax=Brevibacillus invocatus TaxID=173959 RepID=UPI00203B8EC2|nr:type 2 isopentenyl-diphosphate Delta-isomerase [Brevibacillus invocatus]MCM3077920.1 type 2 isopentenyl-diphosphate Delta-isomerase [Brevibacillus invocatus]MCM3428006.1 type 2 isopentenyl-diphosphate Delta-isomerase [Brevibacillus invocatus]